MKHLKVLSALGLIAIAGAAHADVTANATVVSDYDWRGFTQTNNKPALQVGLDYSHSSGFYLGTWGSNIEWAGPDANTEMDYYGGFKFKPTEAFGLDFGVIDYTYANASHWNTYEVYAKATLSVFSAGIAYSPDFFDTDEHAMYFNVDAAVPLGSTPLSFVAHVGHSTGKGVEKSYGIDGAYTDYSAGVTYASDNFTVGLKYVAAKDVPTKDGIVLSFGTALPWAK